MKEKKLIIDYIKKGNLDLEEIINDYTPYIEKIIDNISLNSINKDDKEEIASDVVFIIWKNRETLKADKVLSSYIAGITKNLVREKLRKTNKYIDISELQNTLYQVDDIKFFNENIEKINMIEELLKKMKEIDREIYKGFYYYSKSIKDIAKELNISEFNVKTRLYRIRNKIRRG